MPELVLVIGNYNLSSWSLRPWLAMEAFGIPFRTLRIELGSPHEKTPEVKAAILEQSPSGRVPALKHEGMTICDSLAICEYVAELNPGKRMWPEDPRVRAQARSVSAEMHSGFADLRNTMFMNFTGSTPLAAVPAKVGEDIRRIQEIWRSCRSEFGAAGPWLFGGFSIADAMFAPVVSRFTTYAVQVDDLSEAYMNAMWKLPAMQKWLELARREA